MHRTSFLPSTPTLQQRAQARPVLRQSTQPPLSKPGIAPQSPSTTFGSLQGSFYEMLIRLYIMFGGQLPPITIDKKGWTEYVDQHYGPNEQLRPPEGSLAFTKKQPYALVKMSPDGWIMDHQSHHYDFGIEKALFPERPNTFLPQEAIFYRDQEDNRDQEGNPSLTKIWANHMLNIIDDPNLTMDVFLDDLASGNLKHPEKMGDALRTLSLEQISTFLRQLATYVPKEEYNNYNTPIPLNLVNSNNPQLLLAAMQNPKLHLTESVGKKSPPIMQLFKAYLEHQAGQINAKSPQLLFTAIREADDQPLEFYLEPQREPNATKFMYDLRQPLMIFDIKETGISSFFHFIANQNDIFIAPGVLDKWAEVAEEKKNSIMLKFIAWMRAANQVTLD